MFQEDGYHSIMCPETFLQSFTHKQKSKFTIDVFRLYTEYRSFFFKEKSFQHYMLINWNIIRGNKLHNILTATPTTGAELTC